MLTAVVTETGASHTFDSPSSDTNAKYHLPSAGSGPDLPNMYIHVLTAD